MERVATVDLEAAPGAVFPYLEDLGRYPEWTELVTRAQRLEPGPDGRPAWAVDLRGTVGPLARSKRLRMVRSHHDALGSVVFDRAEDDARSHASWTLAADVEATGSGCRVTVTFTYGGSLWGPLVERLLGDEIEQSKPRLAALVR